ncbi:MAG: arsenic metallochaperone ArsD family protein [Vagococcus sp.]
MIKLEVFDEVVIDGPVSKDLVRITDIFELFQQVPQIDATRFELATQTKEFERYDDVMALILEKGAGCLPITVLNGDIVKYGDYPSNEEVSSYTGILIVDNDDASCCGGGGCGCSCDG